MAGCDVSSGEKGPSSLILAARGSVLSGVFEMAMYPDEALQRRRPLARSGSEYYRQSPKRLVDIALVVLSLPLVLPIMAVITLALLIEGGNPFYAQDRLGRGGRRFRVWKFRTMVRDADAILDDLLAQDPALRREWNATQKLRNDPRITRVGKVLRRTSLDELPQLFNILRGDMSIVGPRPMMPDQLELYGAHASAYFALRPGLTGLWQVSARNDVDFSQRARLDAVYERTLSFWQDMMLILATFRVVLRGTGH